MSRRQRGFSLVETMVAVALLGVIVVTVLSGFSSIALAAKRHGVATTLDRLARSDAEYVKSQAYQAKPAAYTNLPAPAGYSFASTVLYYSWFNQTFATTNAEFGFQEIRLTVRGPSGASEQLTFFKGRR